MKKYTFDPPIDYANQFVTDVLKKRTEPHSDAVNNEKIRTAHQTLPLLGGFPTVGALKNYLKENRSNEGKVIVNGYFYPGALLFPGWWERKNSYIVDSENDIKLDTDDPVRNWLYHGFDAWAPSFDISFGAREDKNIPFFLGQIGDGDEADSIGLIIHKKWADKSVHEEIEKSKLSFRVKVVGDLYSRYALPKEIKDEIKFWGKEGEDFAYDYWIVVKDDEKSKHEIEISNEKGGIYSGYLWKCLAPKNIKEPQLNEVFFLWEHTNFASEDAIKFNMESLDKKTEMLQTRYKKSGELVLHHRSFEIIKEDKIHDRLVDIKETFYNSLFVSR